MTLRRIFSVYIKPTFKTAFSSKYLFYTNALLASCISSTGDLLQQSYEFYTGHIDHYTPQRTVHMACAGAIIGMLSHHWYKNLDRVIVGATTGTVFKKILLDQTIAAPILILSFFATFASFEDDPIKNFTDEVSGKFLILYRADCLIWPPAQFVNFYFLPTRFRVAFVSTINLFFGIYNSRVKHRASKNEPKDD